jgi:hypothetical protein
MKKTVTLLSIIYFITSCQPTSEQAKSQYGEWQNLFNGQDLSGWTKQGSFHADVQNNAIVLKDDAKKEGGWLLFDKHFEDFRVELEFLVAPGNNSGIAVRYNDTKKGHPAVTSYEVNIDHNLDQQNPTGSIFNVSRAKWLPSTKPDDWNKMAIEAIGDHLKVFIGDTIVTEIHNRRSFEGMIGLQSHGGQKQHEAKFRNIRIKEFEPSSYLGPQVEDYMRNTIKRKLEPMIVDDNLDDWYHVGEASWDVDEGVIHGYSNENGGFLVHKETYRNFYLKLKFKIAHEDNSGIFIRHSPDATDEVSTDNAIECNIYDHDGFLHEFSTGAIVPYARAWSKMVDYDDWNDMEIFAFDDQIIMYVNGVKSSEAHLPEKFNQTGNICIQGGIQVFNGDLPSDILIKDMYVKDFEGIPFVGY